MNTIEEAKRLHKLVESCKNDPLKAFVAQIDADQLAALRIENLQKLFTEARKLKVRYIFIDNDEICGCEGIRDSGGTWPAMWTIVERVGFPGSCGNSDQYQCNGADIVFPSDSLGGWDLKENRKLTNEEVAERKFSHVTRLFRRPK